MRKSASLVLVAGLVVTLAACSPTTNDDTAGPVGDGCTASGPASQAVDVTGDFGAAPEVAIEGIEAPDTTERSVVIEGDGPEAVTGASVAIDFVMYSAESGDEFEGAGTQYDGTTIPITIGTPQFLPGMDKTLACSNEGDRVVGVIPPVDSWGEGVGQAELGVAADESIVFIADIVSVSVPLERADGEDQPVVEGLPTVELEEDGRPLVTLPETDPPTELQIATLKKGDGATVEADSGVVLHYQGTNWTSGEIFDESWTREGAPQPAPATGFIPGFAEAIAGATVGSQILVVIPPAEGYGEAGQPDAGIAGTDTLVFVVDILAVV